MARQKNYLRDRFKTLSRAVKNIYQEQRRVYHNDIEDWKALREEVDTESKNLVQVRKEDIRRDGLCEICGKPENMKREGVHYCNVLGSFQCRCGNSWESGCSLLNKTTRKSLYQRCRSCNAEVNCNDSWVPMDDLPSPIYGHMSDLCEGCILWGDCRGYFYQPAVVNGVLSIITGEKTMKWIQKECGITCNFDLRGSSNSVTISPHVHIYKDAEDKVSEILDLGSKVFMPRGALKSLIVLSERPASDWNPEGMSQVASDYKPEENSQCAIDSEYDFDPQPRRKKKKEGRDRVKQVFQNRGPPGREFEPEMPENRRLAAPLDRYGGDNFGPRTIGQLPNIQERFRQDRSREDIVPGPVQPIQVLTLRAPEVPAERRASVVPREPPREEPRPAEQQVAVSEQQSQVKNLEVPAMPAAPGLQSSSAFVPEAEARYRLRGRPMSVPQFSGKSAPVSTRYRSLMDTLRKTIEEIAGYDRAIDDVGSKCDQLRTLSKHLTTILKSADVDLQQAEHKQRHLKALLKEQISKRKKLEREVTRRSAQIQREQRETEKLKEELKERKYTAVDKKEESPQQHSSVNTSKNSIEHKYSRSQYSSDTTGVHSYNLVSTEDSKTFSIPSKN